MKKCCECKIEKDISCFGRNRARKDQLQSLCKECDNIRATKYHHKNKEKLWPQIKARKLKRVIRNREYVTAFKAAHPCIDCGNKDTRVLDFDHVTGGKENNICNLVNIGISMKALILEINKCVVRCANCHRIKTSKERNYYSYLNIAE